MVLKGIQIEDFLQYKKPSMFLITKSCTFKCEKDCGKSLLCQNGNLVRAKDIEVANITILKSYHSNPITKALVIGGLEPFDQFEEVKDLIHAFRNTCEDDVVIYTGYNYDEIVDQVEYLRQFRNIIIKFGRYIPDHKPHYDDVLGVYLASDNQYAEKIS